MPILGYGKLWIKIIKQKQYITILLFNVVYIVDYSINFVFMSIVEDKGMHSDN